MMGDVRNTSPGFPGGFQEKRVWGALNCWANTGLAPNNSHDGGSNTSS